MQRRIFLLGSGAALAAGGGWIANSFFQMGTSASYDEGIAPLRAPLGPKPNLTEIVRYATLAANSHNTQPWRFRISEKSIQILPDFTRRTPAVDPDDHHLYVSLGCAAENLALAARAHGMLGEPRFDPANGGKVIFDFTNGAEWRSPLYEAIPLRQSTRAEYDARPALRGQLVQLEVESKTPGVDLVLITNRARIDLVRDLVISGNNAQMSDSAFVAELKRWIRFNPRAALKSGDGLYSATTGNPVLPTWLGARMFELAFRPAAENEKYARQINSSSGVAVFSAVQADPAHWIRVGRACQRFALQATALGMKSAFINQPVEVAGLRPELAALVGMPGRRPDIVMRFGYGPALPMSPRRPVDAVIDQW